MEHDITKQDIYVYTYDINLKYKFEKGTYFSQYSNTCEESDSAFRLNFVAIETRCLDASRAEHVYLKLEQQNTHIEPTNQPAS